MTPEEKFRQLFMIPGDITGMEDKYKAGIFGFQVNTAGKSGDAAQQILQYDPGANAYETAVKINQLQRFFLEKSRLGIPLIPFDEALHGLVRDGATAFPQSIALAATWNKKLVHQIADAIAQECKTRGIRQILSPVVNIASDVRWGRTEETYGEDPYLASEMGVAFVSAFEKKGIITTPKHFVANVGDGGRDSYPIHWNDRLMREIYLPPFEACFKRGGSRSVMTSYNSYDGSPCTAHDALLNQLLKKEWGFDGFVISDAGATGGANVLHFTAKNYADATTQSITNGLDVIFQTSIDHESLFSTPFLNGDVKNSVVDSAVFRVLKKKFELGLFENPYSDPDEAKKWNGHTDHRTLAKKAALESMVLLKNNKKILPLSKNVRSIAVIGPDADEARLGGYSGPGNNKVSLLTGIKNKAGNNIKVNYSYGCKRTSEKYEVVPGKYLSNNKEVNKLVGLYAEYFNNVTFSGKPVFTRIDEKVNFQWTLFSPDPEKLSYDFYSVKWSGKIKSPTTGRYKIGIDGNDGYRLYLNGKLLIDNIIKRSREVKVAEFDFIAGREYDIRIEYAEPVGNAWFKLIWNVGVKDSDSKQIEDAVKLASKSDLAIISVGIEEGEFQDRASLRLPGRQEELIQRIAATGKPIIVLLTGGSAITMSNWMDKADAIIQNWYAGEDGGSAIADVLFGDYNPAGRLPITFPVFEGQLPLVYNHKPTGRGDDYINLTGQPLFPFGYGLSYTTFDYSDMKLSKSVIKEDETVTVSCKITNTGNLAGDEVVQLYIRDELASLARPVMELKSFERIHLKPGESKTVSFEITPEALQMYDINMKKVVEPGDFRIMIGASSKDIRLRGILKVE
ncbi:MAG: glycoside hydrolase family 3 C-terminal domain-containing protein [Saprospiraceae bacterium]|nr:glycoside hydrolase family 3 C-terminal domain-containing protein [Saprospiraceae bacterium]